MAGRQIIKEEIFFSVLSEEEPDTEPNSEPQSESDATDSEPLTVIQQPEVTPPQPVANQAMKGKMCMNRMQHCSHSPTLQVCKWHVLMDRLVLFDTIFHVSLYIFLSFLSQPNWLACPSPSLLSLLLSLSPPVPREGSGRAGYTETGVGDGGVRPQEVTPMRMRKKSRKTKAPGEWLLSRKQTLAKGWGSGVCWSRQGNR